MLLLMRHAKSSWADPAQPDYARPLNERGRQAAPLMGRFLRRHYPHLELIISSPAERARQTAQLAHSAAQFNCALTYDARIYEASALCLLAVVNEITEPASIVLLVGHNPGMEEFVRLLTAAPPERMPTAAVACIKFELATWRAVTVQTGRLSQLSRPKEIMSQFA